MMFFVFSGEGKLEQEYCNKDVDQGNILRVAVYVKPLRHGTRRNPWKDWSIEKGTRNRIALFQNMLKNDIH